jgi:hypothetical protein
MPPNVSIPSPQHLTPIEDYDLKELEQWLQVYFGLFYRV